jgi:hypothetical protein
MDNCVTFLVVGVGKEQKPAYIPAGVDTNTKAQAEVETGKDGPLSGKDGPLTSADDHDKPLSGVNFERGVLHVKGKFITDRIGGHSFLSLSAANGWLNSPAGLYFTSRMGAVMIIATNACGPDLSGAEFISTKS